MAEKKNLSDNWYQRAWLPFAAATYIIICIFDFIIMPVYVAAHNSRIETRVFATLESKDAATFADGLVKANQAQRQWNPLTLLGGGMIHLSFGALLTGGAVTRGFAKKSEVEGYYRQMSSYYDDGFGGYGGYGNGPQYGGYNRPPPYGNNGYGGYSRQRPMPQSNATTEPMPKTTDLDDGENIR